MKKLSLLLVVGLIFLPIEAFGQTVISNELVDPHQAIAEQDANDPVVAEQHAERASLFEKIGKAARTLKSPFTTALKLMKSSTISGSIKETLEIDGLKIGFKNRIKVEHAYIGNYYRRYDEYEIPVELAPFSAPDDSVNFGITLKENAKMGLWRIYDTFGQAMCPRAGKTGEEQIKPSDSDKCLLDYVGDYMPHSAANVLKMLEPGDMVKVEAPLTLQGGLTYATDLDPKLALDASVQKIYAGAFDIYVFRADNDKVRLRIIGSNSDKWNFHMRLNLIKSYFPTAVRLLIKLFKGFDIVEYDFNKGKENIFLADYTLDFKQQAVRDAYDALFSKAQIYKDPEMLKMLAEMINPRKANDPNRHEDLRKMLVSNLEPIESIYRDQVLAGVKEEDRWIDRNFVGSNAIDIKQSHDLTVGLPFLFRAELETATTENRLTRRDYVTKDGNVEEVRQNYIFPTYTARKRVKSKIFNYDEQLFRSASIIYKANDAFQPISFANINFLYEHKDNKYKPKEHSLLLEHFQQILPETTYSEVLQQLRNNSIDVLSESIKKVRASIRYYINEEGLFEIEKEFSDKKNVADRELKIVKKMAEYLQMIGYYTGSSDSPDNGEKRLCAQAGFNMNPNVTTMSRKEMVLRFSCGSIVSIARKLAVVVWKSKFDVNNVDARIASAQRELALQEALARKAAMDGLAEEGLFRKIGPGFIFSLFNKDTFDFNKVARFEMLFFLPHQEEPIPVALGHVDDKELYEQILEQQRMLVDETPDLRLDGTKETLTERNSR